MIICRSPFRISYFGGGTDFPDWYNNHGDGLVLSTTINKYCHVFLRTLPPFFSFNYRLRYYDTETVSNIKEIKHLSIKAILNQYHKSKKVGLEIIHYADLPALSGLGASSAFTNALIHSIHEYNNNKISKKNLAKKSIFIEKKILLEDCGCQDQYATALGGFNEIIFKKKNISLKSLNFKKEKKKELEENTVIFFTGISRKANIIESEKVKKIKKKLDYYREIYQISSEARNIFCSKNDKNFLDDISKLLNESWRLKKSLSNNVTNNQIDEIYNAALKNGAMAGKILGAGGGGFIMFITKNSLDRKKLIKFLNKLIHVNFKFENDGTKIISKTTDAYK
jgi:D-glycero-alpha-D-manno-heptose-7-phosphate kinase